MSKRSAGCLSFLPDELVHCLVSHLDSRSAARLTACCRRWYGSEETWRIACMARGWGDAPRRGRGFRWQLETRTSCADVRLMTNIHSNSPFRAICASDTFLACVDADKHIMVMDVRADVVQEITMRHPVAELAWCGAELVIATTEPALQRWDLNTMRACTGVQTTVVVRMVVVSDVVVVSDLDDSVSMVVDRDLVPMLSFPSEPVVALECSNDDRWVAVVTHSGATVVRIRSGQPHPPTCIFALDDDDMDLLICATFTDGDTLVLGTHRGKIVVIDLRASQAMPALSEADPHSHPCVVVRTVQLNVGSPVCSLSANGTHLASGSQGVIELRVGTDHRAVRNLWVGPRLDGPNLLTWFGPRMLVSVSGCSLLMWRL